MRETTQLDASDDTERQVMGGWMLRREAAEIVRGEGSWLEDTNARRYLDLTSGYGTAPLGHCHPKLVKALSAQAESLWAAPAFLLCESRRRYLDALRAVLPEHLQHVFLANSGAEAVEAGLKFARVATGRSGIVALKGSFHGRTMGALAATANAKARQPESVLESSDVRFVRRDDFEGLNVAVDESCAAIVLEVIQGEGGVHPCAPEFLAAAQELARDRGALLMVDEIQTGFGRTGTMFASAKAALQPDLMALAKGAGGGFPLGALAYTPAVESSLRPGVHGSTFGGNALACASGLALLETLAEEDIVARGDRTGDWLGGELERRLGSLAKVREVRGRGMMWAVQLRERAGRYLAQLTKEHGVLALPAGSNVIRLLPPLNASREELDFGLDALQAVLGGDDS